MGEQTNNRIQILTLIKAMGMMKRGRNLIQINLTSYLMMS